MNDADRRLVALATAQRQVFTRAQARELGLGDTDLLRRVASGRFVVHGPHTLHFAGAALDWRGQLLGRPSRSGARCGGVGPVIGRAPRAGRLPGGSARIPGHRGPRGTGLRSDPSDRPGPWVRSTWSASATCGSPRAHGRSSSSPAGSSERELGNAVDSACRLGLTAPAALQQRLDRLGRRGRTGVGALRRVMESAGVQSWLERQFLRLVIEAGLPRPMTQRVYRRGGVHIARVDFDFEPWPVIGEVGGRRGYMSADERRRQEHRRNELQLSASSSTSSRRRTCARPRRTWSRHCSRPFTLRPDLHSRKWSRQIALGAMSGDQFGGVPPGRAPKAPATRSGRRARPWRRPRRRGVCGPG